MLATPAVVMPFTQTFGGASSMNGAGPVAGPGDGEPEAGLAG